MPGRVKEDKTRFIEINGPIEFHGQSFVVVVDLYSADYYPTDLYYSDVAAREYASMDRHDWDYDGNHVYGEMYGGNVDRVNGMADIHVGRVPVETPADVVAFIDKITRYEKFIANDGSLLPMDFAVSILLGSANWYPNDPFLDRSAFVSEEIKHRLQNATATDPTVPPRWIFTRRYEDYNDVPEKGLNLDTCNRDTMVAALTTGQNGVSLVSHGDHTGVCCIGLDDVNRLVNHPGIYLVLACNTGMFDIKEEEAISERAILNPSGGAVAYIGCSRMGSTGDGPLGEVFWEALPSSERLGDMFKTAMLYAPYGGNRAAYNLLGDPAMRVWSDRPRHLDVSHASTSYIGQSFSVTVTSNGKPVPNALVCFTVDGTLFATCTTDVSGKASCMITPSIDPGTLYVTVSGKNLIPYFGTVTVLLSVKDIATRCLSKYPPISVRRDIYGGSNPQDRTLREQLKLILKSC